MTNIENELLNYCFTSQKQEMKVITISIPMTIVNQLDAFLGSNRLVSRSKLVSFLLLKFLQGKSESLFPFLLTKLIPSSELANQEKD